MREDYINFSLDLPEFVVQDIEVTETETIIRVQKKFILGWRLFLLIFRT